MGNECSVIVLRCELCTRCPLALMSSLLLDAERDHWPSKMFQSPHLDIGDCLLVETVVRVQLRRFRDFCFT